MEGTINAHLEQGLISEHEIFIAEILKLDFQEDFSLPRPPKGFVKVKSSPPKFIRKSSIVWSLYYARERVSTDRLRRFITDRKKTFQLSNNVFVGNFIQAMVNEVEETIQVLGFRKLIGNKENCFANYWHLNDEKGHRVDNVAMIANLYRKNSSGKLEFTRALVDPVNLKSFVRHIEPKEFFDLLS